MESIFILLMIPSITSVCRNWTRFVGIESVNPYRSSARYFDEIVLSSSIRGHHRKSYVGIHIVAVENPTNHNYPP